MRGLYRFAGNLSCALAGLRAAWREEEHLRWQVGAASVVMFVARWTGQSAGEWALLVMVSSSVLVAQMLNWVLERTLGLVTLEYHPSVRKAKDAAAGAVLLTAASAVVVFLLVVWPDLGSLGPRLVRGWTSHRVQLVSEVLAVLIALRVSFRTYATPKD